MTKEEIEKAKRCYQYLSGKSHDNWKDEKEVSNILECDNCLTNFFSNVENLQQENQKQNAILDILKSNVVVCIDYKGSNPNNICYLLIFNNGNQTIIKEITKEQYDLIVEWKDNDRV